MKAISLVIPIFLLGCTGQDSKTQTAYNAMCDRQPDSVSCTQYPKTSLLASYHLAVTTNYEMLSNFTYVTDIEQYGVSDYWFDNGVTNVHLKGDCDDVALTYISQLILDGVNPGSIRFVSSGIDGVIKHNYAQVTLSDGSIFSFNKIDAYTDIMYMQYDNIGKFINIKEQ